MSNIYNSNRSFRSDLGIDIAYYIQQIEAHTAAAIHVSETKLKHKGKISCEDRLNIILGCAMKTAEKLEEETYREVKKKEQKSYDYPSNEMNLFALATILAAWSGWVFKSKSEDLKRPSESREKAAAVSKYIESIVRNAVEKGQKLGEGGGRPEGKTIFMEID
jgi:hypothetical protein